MKTPIGMRLVSEQERKDNPYPDYCLVLVGDDSLKVQYVPASNFGWKERFYIDFFVPSDYKFPAKPPKYTLICATTIASLFEHDVKLAQFTYSGKPQIIELIEDELAYLQQRLPDGEWELRKPVFGDNCLLSYESFEATIGNISPSQDMLNGIRFCRKKKVGSWVECPVTLRFNSGYGHRYYFEYRGQSYLLHKLSGFRHGGVKFEGAGHWDNVGSFVNLSIDEEPRKIIACRIWEEGAE